MQAKVTNFYVICFLMTVQIANFLAVLLLIYRTPLSE